MVDRRDRALVLSLLPWHVEKKAQSSHLFYATRKSSRGSTPQNILMHRLIIDAPAGVEVDHRDGNGLNNTRQNIRLASHSQNMKNSRSRKNNRSGYKGVSWCPREEGWRSYINVNGKFKSLGYHETAEAAAKTRDLAAKKYHADFANLNFGDQAHAAV
jgi:hypothetical protein